MDFGTFFGLAGVWGMMLLGIMSSGKLGSFIDIPAMLITGGGCFFATIVRFPLSHSLHSFSIISKSLFTRIPEAKNTINELISLAEMARKESILALERVDIGHIFMRKGIRMAVDGREPETIRTILQIDLDSMVERHTMGREFLESIAEFGPAFGLVGSLLGMVIMLGNLEDPSMVGPSMAVALMCTFYGTLISNCFALPLATKLRVRSNEEARVMKVIIAGVLSILAGENPRIIRERLESFLPPSQRTPDENFGGGQQVEAA